MGTITKSPPPNGPIGWVFINGQRIPVEPDPLWYRFWTEQMDAARVLQDGTITTEKAQPNMATSVYSVVDVSIGQVYGYGRFIVFGLLIPPQPVDCVLSVAATFDASGQTAFDGNRFGMLFVTESSNVTDVSANYKVSRFVDPTIVQYKSSAPVNTVRTKCAINAPFNIVKGVEYIAGVMTLNQIPSTTGLTFYGNGTIEAQAIKI